MLRSFRLGNHRSFRDEQELLLMPALPGEDRPVVPVAAIYGANASGKSSLVSGLDFMREAVTGSFTRWEVDGGVPRQPCALSGIAVEDPSVFVAELVAQGVRYTYGFTVDAHRVREEWLYAYPEKRRRVLFERDGDLVRFGSTVTDLKAKLAVAEELTRPNVLFLSVCGQLVLEPVAPVHRWFSRQLRIRSLGLGAASHRIAHMVGDYIVRRPEQRDRVAALLAAADVGITGIRATRAERLPPGVRDGEPWWELKLTHGEGAEFDLAAESAGTRNWLSVLPEVLEVLDGGHVLVVDEIDASLHPLLTAQLIGLFHDERTNPKSAQLVFTTHDTSLLGTTLGEHILNRDEIWFTEKRRDGSTELVALTDFKPRKDHNLERRYLGGSFGGVPVMDRHEFVEAVVGR